MPWFLKLSGSLGLVWVCKVRCSVSLGLKLVFSSKLLSLGFCLGNSLISPVQSWSAGVHGLPAFWDPTVRQLGAELFCCGLPEHDQKLTELLRHRYGPP